MLAMLAAAALATLLVVPLLGMRLSYATLLFLSLTLVPKVLVGVDGPRHVGITGPGPQLTNYLVLLVVGAIAALSVLHEVRSKWMWIGYVVYLLFGALEIWDRTDLQVAGLIQYASIPIAWLVGATLFNMSDWPDRDRYRFVSVCLIFVVIQLLAGALELAGFQVRAVSQVSADYLVGRVNGTTPHPGTLGKLMFLIAVFILPQTMTHDIRTRRCALATVALAVVVTGMTGGRANFVGILLAVIVWALVMPRSGARSGRVALLAATVVVGVWFGGYFIERFQQDSQGGSRAHFATVAHYLIARHPWTGVGPNTYVEAGSFDKLTSAGFPVHNCFLLVRSELGAIGAVLLFVPIGALIASRLRSWRARDDAGHSARALLAGIPGLSLIAVTGWGLMGGPLLPLTFLFLGSLASGGWRSRTDPSIQTPAGAVPAVRLASPKFGRG